MYTNSTKNGFRKQKREVITVICGIKHTAVLAQQCKLKRIAQQCKQHAVHRSGPRVHCCLVDDRLLTKDPLVCGIVTESLSTLLDVTITPLGFNTYVL